MNRLAIGLAITAAVALQAAAASAASSNPPDRQASIERGRQIAQRNCTGCHAIGLRGDSPNAKAPPFRELYRRYPAGALDEAFQDGLLNRHPAIPEMPEFRFLPREIADLTAYVHSVQGAGGLAMVQTRSARTR
jgi:mono/diheme cytochrome c family protein